MKTVFVVDASPPDPVLTCYSDWYIRDQFGEMGGFCEGVAHQLEALTPAEVPFHVHFSRRKMLIRTKPANPATLRAFLDGARAHFADVFAGQESQPNITWVLFLRRFRDTLRRYDSIIDPCYADAPQMERALDAALELPEAE